MSSITPIQDVHELDNSNLVVDPRSFYQRCWDALQLPYLPLIWAAIATVICLFKPGFVLLGFVIFLVMRLAVTSKPDVLPIHLPMSAGKIDQNDPRPGLNNGFNKASGAFYVGRTINTRFEIWLSFKALTQHFLIFGTTGAGKTESFVSYIVNFLSVGSGCAFQDAKAAPKAMIQIATICRIFGRDDDFRVTNYITPINTQVTDPAERSSNDAAIFARGSADSNTQLLVSLIPASEGENKLFSERAIALVAALQPALTDLRDQGRLLIDPAVIRDHMAFQTFATLYKSNFITMKSRRAMRSYLESLPGFDEKKAIDKQAEEVTRQFGFAQAYFTRALASLSDTFGHIYLTTLGEIDYQDAVLNGRILMTLLPSLQKSGEELENLGKIVQTALRNGMVVGLGTHFEGSARDMVYNLPTNSEIPYLIANDENAYMLLEGQEMMNAQARGLGFCIMTGTQDAPGMLEKISRTTKQIMANSAFKQIGYLDDKETTELACEFSGKARVMERGNYNHFGDFNTVHADKNIQVKERNRIETTDVKRLQIGQAFILYRGKVHLTQLFNHGIQEKAADPKYSYVSHWYSVRMPKVVCPDAETMLRLCKLAPEITEWQELATLVSDEMRETSKEMTRFFKSILRVNQISAEFVMSSEFKRSVKSQVGYSVFAEESDFGKQNLLGSSDELVGVLGKVLNAPIPSYNSVPALLAAVARDTSIAEVKLSREAEAANLGMPDMSDLDNLDTSSFTSGGDDDTTGGGGGRGVKPQQSADDLLASYLGGNSTPAGNEPEHKAEPEAPKQPHSADTSPQEAKAPARPIVANSALSKAVERNLHLMPWMANAIDYEDTVSDLLDIEEAFTGDRDQAAKNLEDGFDLIASKLKYPETKIKQQGGLDIETARSLLGPMLKGKN